MYMVYGHTILNLARQAPYSINLFTIQSYLQCLLVFVVELVLEVP